MLKGREKEASSHGACLSSRREDEVLSLPPAAADVFVLSSQQCFLAEPFLTVFLESRAVSPVTYKRFKTLVGMLLPKQMETSTVGLNLLYVTGETALLSRKTVRKGSARKHC